MSNNVAPLPFYNILQQLKQETFKDLRVALPGSIAAVNANGTVDVTVGVMQNVSQPGLVTGLDFNYPVLSSCVLLSSQGGGVGSIMPVAVKDECWVVFSDRCIDAWFQSGGPAPLPDFRMHDISDGFVIVGPNSLFNPLVTSLAVGAGGICETRASAPGVGARVAIDPTTHLINIANGAAGVNSLLAMLTNIVTELATLNTAIAGQAAVIPAAAATATAQTAAIAATLASLGTLLK